MNTSYDVKSKIVSKTKGTGIPISVMAAKVKRIKRPETLFVLNVDSRKR